MHGLAGCSSSWYVMSVVDMAKSKGWHSLVMVARGCGGVELTTGVSFTAARTKDFGETIQHIQSRYPGSPIYAIGYSLGAGLLAKYLGERGDASGISGAVCVSPPWDFHKTTEHFEVWSRHKLVRDLKLYVRQNYEKFKALAPQIDLDTVLKSANVREFDANGVVPVIDHYRDVDDYYTDASPKRFSREITTPTLAISSEDDPVCSVDGVPMDPNELGPGLVIVKTCYGGHVAYGKGWIPVGMSWADEVAFEWFEAHGANK
mmetsp:Transcript_15060/g.27120  ORF Transcript_15060/g.27120 Transcript_15060/m.27120 type:complete len:261 (+) Transcript_15060:72-854(+)|eukprot:CAMPEP_0197531572 /NCGR_PEP_ID=MMETSP1318-20131121/36262_1 /TAXON_ID=552666 /ORGANISM="Partenskyella glossopodia, Strain RCC365" /LENGTH=260 /DNA_ID=CAMNT_0043087851 /DNA_START=83 /DNA_END=865 /DNA_ORIENTATION=-